MDNLKIGIVGTGYIADYHAQSIENDKNSKLIAVCDVNRRRGESFMNRWNIKKNFISVEEMIQSCQLDLVHILTPPHTHFSIAKQYLTSGVHVFLEKPMCINEQECHDLVELAKEKKLYLGVNHNFLFYPVFNRLYKDIQSGQLGRILDLSIVWNRPLTFINNGPFDIWMLNHPGNIMLEIGSHLLSELIYLLGKPEKISSEVSDPVILPGNKIFFRKWNNRAEVNKTAVSANLSFNNGFSEYYIHVRGTFGKAVVDFESNTYYSDFSTGYSMDFDNFIRTKKIGSTLKKYARINMVSYLLSKIKLGNRGNVYQNSINQSISSFYKSIINNTETDERVSNHTGEMVIKNSRKFIAAATLDNRKIQGVKHVGNYLLSRKYIGQVKASVLVLGGTGFIGRYLVSILLEHGYLVRLFTRQKSGGILEIDHPNLEIYHGSMQNFDQLEKAFLQIDYVYHLARIASSRDWSDYYNNDVLVTKKIGEFSLKYNIKRIIYTGTIDSFFSGNCRRIILETTPLDKKIRGRNLYARCKAQGEQILMELYEKKSLPVVIMRPGIVIGRGSSPCHWGVGMWNGLGFCQVWGKDDGHKLPFILVDDVAKGLLKGLEVEGIEGKQFHLIDKPLISAREYLSEMEDHGHIKLQIKYVGIMVFFLNSLIKWLIKVMVRHPGRKVIPTYRDWLSRTHRSVYNCEESYRILNWVPSSNKDRLIRDGIHKPLDEIL